MPRVLAAVALVVSIGTVAAYMTLLGRPLPIVVAPAWYLGALAVATVLAVLAVIRSRRWLPISALAITALLLSLAGVFNFVIARVPAPASAFVPGRPAPDFTLPDAAGRPVRLADFRGKNPVVLVFYRGSW